MAEVIEDQNGNPYIKLTLKSELIHNYKLESVINDSIYHDYGIVFEKPQELNYKFKFINIDPNDKGSVKSLLELFKSICELYKITSIHIDHLLFLSKIYHAEKYRSKKEIHKDKYLKQNGQLLFEFIKAPLPIYNINSIDLAYKDDDLTQEEINDYLLMNLGIVSGMSEDMFKDNSGNLDRHKIEKGLQYKLIRKVLADTNPSIRMDNGNYLIVSKDISVKFKYLSANKHVNFSTTHSDQNNKFSQFIIESLFNQQKEAGTVFYKALLEHDFLSNAGIDNLSKLKGLWDIASHHISNLKSLYDVVLVYISKERLMEYSSKMDTTRHRNNFVYQYFTLLSIITDPNNESFGDASIEEITAQLKRFMTDKKAKPNFANTKFHDTFKNLNR